MDMGEERKRTYHNLTEEVIRPPIWNWHEFLARWETTTSHQERMGLLHTGYTVPLEKRDWPEPKYDRADRDVFYLRISDGWEDARLLECRGDYSVRDYHLGYDENWNLIRKTPRELRQILARKAFDLLCLNFFRRMEEPSGGGRLIRRERNSDWERLVTSEELFGAIQNFFRVETDPGLEVRNLSRGSKRSHGEELAVTFLLNLTKFVWQWQEPEIPKWEKREEQEKQQRAAVEWRAKIEMAKPWLVQVLCFLERLDVLDNHILELNQSCLDKLREVAMKSQFSLGRHFQLVAKDRQAETLEEACFLGSKVAWFLKKRELMVREGERLKSIHQAELDLAEADERLKEAQQQGKGE